MLWLETGFTLSDNEVKRMQFVLFNHDVIFQLVLLLTSFHCCRHDMFMMMMIMMMKLYLLVFCLKTLSVTQTVQRRVIG
jgi:hypothetical protein